MLFVQAQLFVLFQMLLSFFAKDFIASSSGTACATPMNKNVALNNPTFKNLFIPFPFEFAQKMQPRLHLIWNKILEL